MKVLPKKTARNWQTYLRSNPVEWLLTSNPWTRYLTLVDLLEKEVTSSEVTLVKKELLAHPLIIQLQKEALEWFTLCPKRHDDSKLSHYKLKMLADFGLSIADLSIGEISEKAMLYIDNGTFAIKQAIPEKGSSVEINAHFNEWHSLPCDSPLITTSLLRLGCNNPQVLKTLEIIQDRWRSGTGWFCNLFFVNSQFKKHNVGCMMAALEALDLFSICEYPIDEEIIYNAFKPLKYHKDLGAPLYYFGRSKRFWSLKYPFVWYNALYVADVLSRYEQFKDEEVLIEIIEWILKFQDANGQFKPTSIYLHYKKWDFGNKKEPSPWITYLCCRILKQYYS